MGNSASYVPPEKQSVIYPNFEDEQAAQTGKVFAITGCTTGTGLAAAKLFAKKGSARVFLLNRPSPRAEAALAAVQAAAEGCVVTHVDCDLADFDAVRKAAGIVAAATMDSGLDCLCNNAGVMALKDVATRDGYDVQMQTNHLSHFLLTCELFPTLEEGAEHYGESRLINHSSIARFVVKRLEAKYLEKRGGTLGGDGASMLFSGPRWVRYGQTKLANAVFTAALHQRLQKAQSKVKALVAHPGYANTELQVTTDKHGGMSGWSSLGAKWISQSAEDGTLGLLSCAVLPEAQSGHFYGPGKTIIATKGEAIAFPLQRQCTQQASIDLLWSKSCEAIGQEFRV